MKPDKSQKSDAKLDALLGQWRVETPLDADFQERVWQRIASTESRGSVTVAVALARSWAEQWFSRPAIATGYLAVSLLIGIGAGWLQMRNSVSDYHESLGRKYVQSVDPYQKPH